MRATPDDTALLASEQLLSFRLHDEIFALSISKVREVIDFRTLTRVPRMPPAMRGVINLRGNVVPVIDLHTKFGSGMTESTVDTCIVIAEVEIDGETIQIGALADAVEEVFDMDSDLVEPPPRMGMQLRTEFLRGMGRRDDRFVIILDADRLFAEEARTASHPRPEAPGTGEIGGGV